MLQKAGPEKVRAAPQSPKPARLIKRLRQAGLCPFKMKEMGLTGLKGVCTAGGGKPPSCGLPKQVPAGSLHQGGQTALPQDPQGHPVGNLSFSREGGGPPGLALLLGTFCMRFARPGLTNTFLMTPARLWKQPLGPAVCTGRRGYPTEGDAINPGQSKGPGSPSFRTATELCFNFLIYMYLEFFL